MNLSSNKFGTELGNKKELQNYTWYLELRDHSWDQGVVFETIIKKAILVLFRVGGGCAAHVAGGAAYAVGCIAYAAKLELGVSLAKMIHVRTHVFCIIWYFLSKG